MEAPEIDNLLDNSIILLDKPCGHICHDVTSQVKRILGVSRTGHAGTLDPDVSGVLPVALGRATKLLRFIAAKDKTYICLIKFRKILTDAEIKKLLAGFVGTITQTPPKKSAVRKVPRKRTVHYLHVLESCGHFALFESKVDAGTYMRTICTEAGKKTEGARMEELRRISVGSITENQCHTIQDLIDAVWLWKNKGDESMLRKMLIPVDSLISFQKIVIKDEAARAICHGAQLALPGIVSAASGIKKGEFVSIYTESGKFIGVGSWILDAGEDSKKTHGFAVQIERVHARKEEI